MKPLQTLVALLPLGGFFGNRSPSSSIRAAMISCPEAQLLSGADFLYGPDLYVEECTPAMVVHTVERLAGFVGNDLISRRRIPCLAEENAQRFVGLT